MSASTVGHTLVDLQRGIAVGTVSATDLVRASFDRIAAVEPAVHAFAELREDAALSEARVLDSVPPGERGALHGIPVAVKDIFDVAGMVTRRGSELYREAAPAVRDAESVRRLRTAGAVVIGKTHTHELAFGVVTPQTRNPWDPRRSVGGSSGGSAAAVSTGAVVAATGSDTGGSMRIPAAVCGVVGFKPTFGSIGRGGCATLSWTLDHVGVFAGTAADVRILHGVLAGPDPDDPATGGAVGAAEDVPAPESVRGLRLGVPAGIFRDCVTPEVARVVSAALDRLDVAGAHLVDLPTPWLADPTGTVLTILTAEAATYYADALRERSELIGDTVRAALRAGARISAQEYLRAQRRRTAVAHGFRQAFEQYRLDAVATPTLPTTALPRDQVHLAGGTGETVGDAFVRMTGPFNLAGMPAVSLNAGWTPERLPVGLQLAGRPGADRRLLDVAAVVESELGLPRTPTEPVG